MPAPRAASSDLRARLAPRNSPPFPCGIPDSSLPEPTAPKQTEIATCDGRWALAYRTATGGSACREAPQSSQEVGSQALTCMLLVCVAAAASPPASASLRSCSAIEPSRAARRCLPPLPPEPRRASDAGTSSAAGCGSSAGRGRGRRNPNHHQRAERLPLPPSLFRPLAPPGGRRLSPFTPPVFANIFACACSLCLHPSQIEKGNGVLKNLELRKQPVGVWTRGGVTTMERSANVTVRDIGRRPRRSSLPPREKVWVSADWLYDQGGPDPNLVITRLMPVFIVLLPK